MSERAVVPYVQPIVSLTSRRITGYEALARSRLFGLETPKEMFQAAAELNLEAQLSRLLRLVALEKSKQLPGDEPLFLNTHSSEIVTAELLQSLRELRDIRPEKMVVLEVHESAVTAAQSLKELRRELTQLGMQLAFDDFGTGQSRLADLAEVHPDVIKFDMQLIRGVDRAPSGQQLMLGNLVRMVSDLGIRALAEGIETEGEHAVCLDVGFELGQGYLYGRPAPMMKQGAIHHQ